MENKEILELTTSAWREKVYIETTEHIINGYIFMPKIGKRNRMLSEVLNGNKNFIAVKNSTVEYKLYPAKNIRFWGAKPIDKVDFFVYMYTCHIVTKTTQRNGGG